MTIRTSKRKASKKSTPYGQIASKKRRFASTAGLYSRRLEIKHVDSFISSRVSTTAAFTLLNAIRLGNNDYNRIGKDVKMQSMMLKGGVQFDNSAGNPTFDRLRYMVIYDRQTNGAAPVIGDIITSVSAAGVTSTTVWDQHNNDKADRFKILLDRAFTIPQEAQTGATVAGQRVVGVVPFSFQHFLPLGGLNTKYFGDAADVSEITAGSLYFVTYGVNAAAAANYIINCSIRVKYTDY